MSEMALLAIKIVVLVVVSGATITAQVVLHYKDKRFYDWLGRKYHADILKSLAQRRQKKR